MKTLFKGEVYEAIPENNSMVFSFNKDLTDSGDIFLDFKIYTYDNADISPAPKNVYLLSKFGASYKKIIKGIENYITVKSILLPEGKVFLLDTAGNASLYDGKGELMWKGILKYRSKVPHTITVAKDGLWGSFPELDAIVRFNASTMRSELRLGKKGDLFDCPKGIFAEDKYLYVCSFGSKKVIRVDLDTYKTEDIYGFTEPLYQYKKSGKREFVNLESGLYEI